MSVVQSMFVSVRLVHQAALVGRRIVCGISELRAQTGCCDRVPSAIDAEEHRQQRFATLGYGRLEPKHLRRLYHAGAASTVSRPLFLFTPHVMRGRRLKVHEPYENVRGGGCDARAQHHARLEVWRDVTFRCDNGEVRGKWG